MTAIKINFAAVKSLIDASWQVEVVRHVLLQSVAARLLLRQAGSSSPVCQVLCLAGQLTVSAGGQHFLHKDHNYLLCNNMYSKWKSLVNTCKLNYAYFSTTVSFHLMTVLSGGKLQHAFHTEFSWKSEKFHRLKLSDFGIGFNISL